jgi:hypothetical protein
MSFGCGDEGHQVRRSSLRYLRALLTALPNAQSADDYAALLPWRIALATK